MRLTMWFHAKQFQFCRGKDKKKKTEIDWCEFDTCSFSTWTHFFPSIQFITLLSIANEAHRKNLNENFNENGFCQQNRIFRNEKSGIEICELFHYANEWLKWNSGRSISCLKCCFNMTKWIIWKQNALCASIFDHILLVNRMTVTGRVERQSQVTHRDALNSFM